NIERAIKKGTGELGGEVYEELSYEGYGPGGVAILVEVLTDNKNRSAANIRTIFAKTGGNLGTTGSVSYMFNRKGVIDYDSEVVSEDEIMEFALEAGADDIINEDGIISVYTAPENFETVLESLQEKNFESVSAEISMVPDTYTALDTETTRKVLKLIERLEEDDDVQNVYSNIDIPEGFEAE
ncbi:MAG TPA: YebC/PmpR family DNA-binding transcriptional regulator, partial [Treponema sp.]|nr:YebC/PmpR family DNA-binding transcriptional regulator [Treponema sp.]